MHNGILVIERKPERIWKNLPSTDRLRLLTYRGYDAAIRWPGFDAWETLHRCDLPLSGSFAPAGSVEMIASYAAALPGIVDTLYVSTVPGTEPPPSGFRFLGYDFGVVVDEDGEPALFSILLNECRPNGNARLEAFIPSLNDSYLLPDMQTGQALALARSEAFAKGETTYLETAHDSRLCVLSRVLLGSR